MVQITFNLEKVINKLDHFKALFHNFQFLTFYD